MSNKIGNIDIYKTLWKCRDFEIDHVWQRAVFLSAFLLACYAGYGGLILGLATNDNVRISFPAANLIAFALACVGLILSLVWIMMAKGSKAWYEHYEHAIEAFEKRNRHAFEYDVWPRGVMDIHAMRDFETPSTSSWLWNTKGGSYSVAKINIVIGHISTVIWGILIATHLMIVEKGFKSSLEAMDFFVSECNASTLIFLFVIMLLLFWLYANKSIRSTFLKDSK